MLTIKRILTVKIIEQDGITVKVAESRDGQRRVILNEARA